MDKPPSSYLAILSDANCIFVHTHTHIHTYTHTHTEHGDMLKDTCKCLKNMIENSDNIIMMRDFNCKEVCWEEWFIRRGEEPWVGILLDLVMNNIMTQWIKENTSF